MLAGVTLGTFASWVTVFAAGVAVGIFGLQQWQRARDRELHGEAELDATHVRFGVHLSPAPVGSQVSQEHAGLELEPWGAGVWVHGVTLSWRYAGDGSWRVDAAPCAPTELGAYPVRLSDGDPLHMQWPPPPPPHHGDMEWDLAVEWGRASKGPTRVEHVTHEDGPTNWQG